MSALLVNIERHDDGLRVLSLQRPERANALSHELLQDLSQSIETCNKDLDARCIVLRGAGGRNFSSGYDTSLLQPEPFRQDPDPIKPVVSAIQQGRLPVIACVNGHVLGGAVEIVAACDIRLAQVGSKIGIPAVRFGICYAPRGLRHMQRKLGLQLASELLLSGQPIPVERAKQQGFFAEVLDPDQIEARALELGQQMCMAAPLAVEAMRAILRADDEFKSVKEDPDDWADKVFLNSLYAADLDEGLAALAEKRPAKFLRK